MKTTMILLTALLLTIGGCTRPMNANRPPRNERVRHKPVPPPADPPGSDRRPNPY